MGVICHGQNPNNEKEILRNMKNNPMFIENKSLNKIMLIQRKIKCFRARIILSRLKKEAKEKISKELDAKKLIDFNKILECKSELYYNKLISSKKIKTFDEIIKNNKNIQKKLNSIKDYTFNFPFYIEISEEKIYKGSWNYNKNYNGYGTIFEFNSEKNRDSRTEGIFIDGLLNGYGRIFLSNEEILVGEFMYNKLNGLGEYYRNDGSIYKGSFFGGLPQGNGEEIFNDGSTFIGFYLAGKKKYGKYSWKNGNYYQGDFYNDIFHGYGVYKWGGERTYEGNWNNGKMDGKGKIMYSDGSYYDGEFKEGVKSGKGIYVWNKDKYYDGEWKNDKQNGYGTYYKNGNKVKGFWIKGKIISNTKKEDKKSIIQISPESKHKTIEVSKNIRTSEGGNDINLISICSNQFNTIRSEVHPNNEHKKLKKNNTHIYISRKVNGKKYLGSIKRNINFNNDENNKEDKIFDAQTNIQK